MVDNLDFSEEEIQEQLAILGYKNIPKHRLVEFKQDLEVLIQRGEWMSLDSPSHCTNTSQLSPPAYFKAKATISEPVFSKPNKDNDGWVPSNCQNAADGQHAHTDSYSQHSVAKRLQQPRGMPSQLQVVTDIEEIPNSIDFEGHIVSPGSQGHSFKRKVLRKYNGELHVCDESVYSEDSVSAHFAIMYKMYNPVDDEDSSDDRNSLYSSFWSDGEGKDDQDDSEEVELERRPLDSLDNSALLTLNEENSDGKKQERFTGDNLDDDDDEGDTQGHDQEDEELRCSSSYSPVPSLITSGYGTYRPEDQEGDDRDDQTINEFELNSRVDPSEVGDEEFGFDVEVKLKHETECDLDSAFTFRGDDVQCRTTAPYNGSNERYPAESNEILWAEEHGLQGRQDDDMLPFYGMHDEGADSNESQRTEIVFINSEVEWMAYDQMCEEWEGNLRPRKDVASSLEDQLSSLQLSPSAREDEDDTELSQSPTSEADDASLSTFELYMRGTARTLNHCNLRPKPKSFIRPIMSQRTTKKTDPVAKYFQYRQLWDMFKCPGEADRRALRWEIKEQLVYQPPPPKPHKVLVPNTYIVPTEKKRSKLRWEVRNALANRLPPYKFSYPF